MKSSPKSILSAAALLIGGFIGASALVVLASGTSTWSPAPGAPSNCPSGTPGCGTYKRRYRSSNKEW